MTKIIHVINVAELQEGDEFWGDTDEVDGTSMFWTVTGPSEPYRNSKDVARKIVWADGGRDVRQWRPDRTLWVRRHAHD